MKKFEDIISIVTIMVFFVVFIFYRHNMIGSCIVAVLLWINVILKIRRKNMLPKPNYYIYKPVIAKYLRLLMIIISIMLFIKYIFLISTRGFHKEFDGFIIIFTPMLIVNFLNDERRIYFYDKGIVWHGEILEFSNINSFKWKEEEFHELNILYKDKEYNARISNAKFEYVDKTLKDYVKL